MTLKLQDSIRHFRYPVMVPYYECDRGDLCQIPPKGYSYPITITSHCKSSIVVIGNNHHSNSYVKSGVLFVYRVDRYSFPPIDDNVFYTDSDISYRTIGSAALSDDLLLIFYESENNIKTATLDLNSLALERNGILPFAGLNSGKVNLNFSKKNKKIYLMAPNIFGEWHIFSCSYEIIDNKVEFSGYTSIKIQKTISREILSVCQFWIDENDTLYSLLKITTDNQFYDLVVYKQSLSEPENWNSLVVFEGLNDYPRHMPQRYCGFFADEGASLIVIDAVSAVFHPFEKQWIGKTIIRAKNVDKSLSSGRSFELHRFQKSGESWEVSSISGDSRYVYISGTTDRGVVSPFDRPHSGFYPNHHYPFVHAFDRYTGTSVGLHSIAFHADKNEVWSQLEVTAEADSFLLSGFVADQYHPDYKKSSETGENWGVSVRKFRKTGEPIDV